ncbi:Additional periplasmic component NikK of nickel ECF transporter [Roseibacterium elongatum DSM 19469]|uniref:Additional periplasmic component NikK of nickel ECF transporter n=1 Tax=Roseicyclus elongatus DSM 19469 TaxID=1294273 RepID=W8RVQ3_9RHOB|nr:DUF4198 domain-containing protein [Roseibacterium elongatum]AHM05289.1 Additional periplasmic component NikK of nickel ECF transporter [Roseibacterium elongatum DSM 19469]
MKRLLSATLAALALANPAAAHFQLIYNPEANPTSPGEMPLLLTFWHPHENGHAMDMGTPQEVFYVFRGERVDISDSLTPVTFTGAHNSAAAFQATLPVRRNGDYTVALVPEPYFEEAEGIYIQQLTTVYLNKGGIPTDWSEPVGLPTEFVPLNRPYNVIAGSTFSAQLLSDGEPVPGAEIEIEYLAAEPDMETFSAGEATAQPMPGGAIVALTDANGVFTFGVPRAGFWGFAALGAGPETEHEGAELSQDAVIWIRAYDME